MKRFYAIDWFVDNNFNNKEESEQKSILLNEIEDANEINNMNIKLIEIENINVHSRLISIIVKASKNEMIKLGYDEIDIDEFEVFY